jgi:hypothetical protein
MDDLIKVDTSNLQILEETFKEMSDACLSAKDERSIFLTAFRKSAVPVVEMIKNNVLTDATERGNLYRSIGTKAVPNEVALYIGSIRKTPYIKKDGKLSQVWYGLLTEGGANNVGRPPKGSSRKTMKRENRGGSIEAKYWFSGAWEWGQWQVYDSVGEEVHNALERFLIRAKLK